MRTTHTLAALAVALLLASCSSSADDATPQSVTTAPAATAPAITDPPVTEPTPSLPTDAELFAAVDAFWALFLELGADTGPFDATAVEARLTERTTGLELDQLVDFYETNALSGHTVKGGVESSLTIVSATPERAEVRDCYDDTTGLYRIDNGERLDTDTPERHQVLYVLENDNGTWKMAEIKNEGLGCVVES